ncbi:MAG: DcrB-related protein [Clostridia bacterium]|nr:DcrB-related protein [Clostridia bacterium]
MKKTLFVAIILVITALLCSCGENTEAPAGMKAVESSDDLNYNFFIPDAWTQDLSTGAVSAYYSTGDTSNVSITTFNIDDYEKTLDDYVNEYMTGLDENLGEFTLIEGYPQNTLLGGFGASKLEYTATFSGTGYKYMQILCIYRGNMYVFTYTSNAEKYDSHLEEVNVMLDNFSFKQ